MAKDLRTFIADLRKESPHEVVEINKVVDPANYDISAIIKHLDDQKKFPVLIFNKPLGLNGKVSPVRVCMNAEISQNKIQIALGVPKTMTRAQLGDECLKREAKPLKPIVIAKSQAPVKEVVQTGAAADLYELPVLRHAEMDGGPYIVMASAVKDMKTGIYNTSYHRMEVKGPQLTALYTSPRHLWRIFTEYEKAGKECPVVTILAHHPCFNMGAAYKGSLDTDEVDIIGGYMKEPLRMTASETWGDDFLVPADAEVIVEGVLVPNERLVEGPFGEAPGYLGPQRYSNALRYEVRAITRRKDAMVESIITPEGDKPWLDLPREAAYLRRCREAVSTVTAVCKGGRHAHYNIFISMNKTAEGDPGRVAAAAFTFDHTKNVFVFDDDIDVYNPTEILWALATRVQPHKQVQVLMDIMRGNMLDPSLQHDIRTSGMIIDATRPLDRPFSPVSKCPDEAVARIKLEEFIDADTLARIPLDRTTYWA